ncbi:MAG: methionine adenosyltransferase domain-containing protein, partial [Roseibacillus sp.]
TPDRTNIMIRCSEAVLSGHPDKFCDRIADAIVAAAYAIDPEAYAQVEVATWSDFIWLNGGIVTRDPFDVDLEKLIVDVGIDTGYCRDALRYDPGDEGCNSIDVENYKISDAICRIPGDPTEWTNYVNDQCIVIGWAGYDERVRFLPPEHFLAHSLREALDASFRMGGRLEKQGPDGKLLVRLRENVNPVGCRRNTWEIEQVLVTVQQRPDVEFGAVCEGVAEVVEEAYEAIAADDPRWRMEWRDIELLVNPNGPLLNGGSDGDNGQTGRKLAVDYYGPRVPIGGGALSGKDLTHIDRAGAYAARKACVEAVAAGEDSCEVLVAYAPGRSAPLEVRWSWEGRRNGGIDHNADRFTHEAARELACTMKPVALGDLARGTHFFDVTAPWNQTDGMTNRA